MAEITPGSARSCAKTELRTFSFAAGETKRRSGALQLNWTRPAVSKPHASLISRSKYCVAVMLAVRSTAAIASSTMTKKPSRRRVARSSVALRDAAPIPPRRSVRAARIAGSKPNPKPLKTITPAAKANTGRSSRAASSNSRIALPVASAPSGLNETSAGVNHDATIRPSAVPITARTKAWTSCRRSNRPRLAPSAARKANSPSRSMTRDKSKPAKFAAAMTSAHKAAPTMTRIFGRRSMTKLSRRGGR